MLNMLTMRKLPMLRSSGILEVAATLLLAAGLASPAAAEKLYHWIDADGTVAFTDELERIPEAQRAGARVIDTAGLDGYARFTPQDTNRKAADDEARRERIERLAAVNEAHAVAALPPVSAPPPGHAPASGGSYTATVDVGGSTIRIPAPVGAGDGPVVVEQVRSVRRGKNVTQTATVVRQGDEILMIVYPEPHRQISSSDFVREEELLD